jgi:hypothetical protein
MLRFAIVAACVVSIGMLSRSAAAAPRTVVVLPPPALAAELRAPLTHAVTQAVTAARLAAIGAAELEQTLQAEPALRSCVTTACQERIGRLLGASAVLYFMASAERTAANKATYQLQVELWSVEVGAPGASMTSTCASCTIEGAAQSLRELTRQALHADAALPRGTLAIESTPSSAAVVVDGNESGVTPYQRSAFVGSHNVILRATGYSSQEATLTVADGRTSRLNVRLVPSTDAPRAGGGEARPVYKKWWFWLALGGAVAAAAITTGVVVNQTSAPSEPPHAINHISF